MRQPTCKVENEKIPFPMTVDFATPCLTDEPNSAVLVLRVPSKVDSEVVSPEFEFEFHAENQVLGIRYLVLYAQVMESRLFTRVSRANVCMREERSTSQNAMVIHNRKHHDGSPVLNFRMEAIKTFISPLERQLNEALRIKYSDADILINSGSEWRLDSVPRASFTAPGLDRRRNAGNNKQ